MKILAIFFSLLFFTNLCLSQSRKPIPKPPERKEVVTEIKPEPVESDAPKLLVELQTAKNNLFACADNYFNKDTSPDKVNTFQECSKSRTAELGDAYTKISQNPAALKLLIGNELDYRYTYGVTKSETENNLRSQADLQRIIVIQNQRIIELLEKLAKGK